MTLTPEQRAAVEATGPLAYPLAYVSAAPGTGKTSVLAARAAHLVGSGVPESEILCITFTRSACQEIRDRIIVHLGRGSGVTVRTFHGHSATELREQVRVASEIEAEAALRSLYEGPTRVPPRPGFEGIDAVERYVRLHEALGYGADGRPLYPEVELLLSRFREAGLVPTWDLVPRMCRREPETWQRYRHVLIDEGQDATTCELRITEAAREGVFLVGDPRQAIMGWRHGDGPKVEPTHSLSHSFRFGPQIAEAVNRLADRFGGQHVEGGGPKGVVETIRPADLEQAVIDGEGRQLVLCRTWQRCREIEYALSGVASLAVRDRRDPWDAEADHLEALWTTGDAAICTVHGAKGREADEVFVVLDRRTEKSDEEKRVAYVAASRARRRLVFVATP